jgi:hypothetical protein
MAISYFLRKRFAIVMLSAEVAANVGMQNGVTANGVTANGVTG